MSIDCSARQESSKIENPKKERRGPRSQKGRRARRVAAEQGLQITEGQKKELCAMLGTNPKHGSEEVLMLHKLMLQMLSGEDPSALAALCKPLDDTGRGVAQRFSDDKHMSAIQEVCSRCYSGVSLTLVSVRCS